MMFETIKDYTQSIKKRDPAARSTAEVLLLYPSTQALFFHRLAQRFHGWGLLFIARMIAQFSRFITGIEIHPGAKIGRNFFIDHGMGVVIGETAEIGDNVMLYHGVTLGGIAPDLESRVKRHPTIMDDAVIGAGAQVLGPITVGESARIGGNAVVTHNVIAGTTVVGIPAKQISTPQTEKKGFIAYATPCDEVAEDPTALLDCMRREMAAQAERIKALESDTKAH